MVFCTLCIALPAVAFVAFYIYRKYFCHNYFKKFGVPGPDPHWFYGNLDELWATEERQYVMQGWAKKYGKIYGYYEGCTPVLVVTTPEGIEQVCIKQFSELGGRRNLPFFPDVNRFPDSPFCNIANVWGDRWKRLKGICNPGFSAAKLKAYTPLIMKSQKEIENLFSELAASGETFEIYEHFRCVALDVVSEVAYGIELNAVKNRGNNPILPKLLPLIDSLASEAAIVKLCLLFPEIIPLLQRLMVFQMKYHIGLLAPIKVLGDICTSVIAGRRSDPSRRRVDILQLLLDASESAQLADGTVVEPLSPIEVQSQALQFFGAGTVTTSSSMACMAHLLAMNPVVQEKLHDEIIQHFPDESTKRDYDVITKMPYLDAVVCETLRLFPIGYPLMTRWATDESTTVCGIPIQKDLVTVQIDGFTIHHDPELWGPVDPTLFHPERFSPEYPTSSRPSTAFIPFGTGPKACIGMRLALFEIKLTMITILSRFRLLPREGTQPGERLKVGVSAMIIPKNGVWVRLEDRKRK